MDVKKLKVKITIKIDEDKFKAIITKELERAMDSIIKRTEQYLD